MGGHITVNSSVLGGFMIMMYGIDISHWQGNVDFEKIKINRFKNMPVSFVMLKAGGSDNGLYTDSCFKQYYDKAKKAGLHIGAYYFVGNKFWGTAAGVADAKRFIKILNGREFDMPVAVDVENQSRAKKAEITAATKAFCDTMEQAGYYCSIYASDVSGFKETMDVSKLTAYDKWVAKYSTHEPSYVKQYGMWQFGGSVNYLRSPHIIGVQSVNCDQNIATKNYPDIIRKNKLNNT